MVHHEVRGEIESLSSDGKTLKMIPSELTLVPF